MSQFQTLDGKWVKILTLDDFKLFISTFVDKFDKTKCPSSIIPELEMKFHSDGAFHKQFLTKLHYSVHRYTSSDDIINLIVSYFHVIEQSSRGALLSVPASEIYNVIIVKDTSSKPFSSRLYRRHKTLIVFPTTSTFVEKDAITSYLFVENVSVSMLGTETFTNGVSLCETAVQVGVQSRSMTQSLAAKIFSESSNFKSIVLSSPSTNDVRPSKLGFGHKKNSFNKIAKNNSKNNNGIDSNLSRNYSSLREPFKAELLLNNGTVLTVSTSCYDS